MLLANKCKHIVLKYFTKTSITASATRGALGTYTWKMQPTVRMISDAYLNSTQRGLTFFMTESGFKTCFGWDPLHPRCWDPIRPRQVPYHEPTSVKGGIETVGS